MTLDANLAAQVPWSRSTVRRDLDKIFGLKKVQIRQQLREAITKIRLSFDLWTSPNKFAMAVHAHFIDNKGKQQNVLIALRRQLGSHDGENLAHTLEKVVRDWNIQDRGGTVISDNATNNDTCLKYLYPRLDSHRPSATLFRHAHGSVCGYSTSTGQRKQRQKRDAHKRKHSHRWQLITRLRPADRIVFYNGRRLQINAQEDVTVRCADITIASEIVSLEAPNKHKSPDNMGSKLVADSGSTAELAANSPPSRSPGLVHDPNSPQDIELKNGVIQPQQLRRARVGHHRAIGQ